MPARIRLWLDDHAPAPEGWTTVTNLDAARSLIEAGVDEISIGDRLDREHGHVLDLVRWLVVSGRWPKERPTVHGEHRVRSTIVKGAIAVAWPLRERIPGLVQRIPPIVQRMPPGITERLAGARELAERAARLVPERLGGRRAASA